MAYRIEGPIGINSILQTNYGHSRQYYMKPGINNSIPAPSPLKVTKKFIMPKLETFISGNKTKNLKEVKRKLYTKNTPHLKDVQQGNITNCPLAAILAALAYTEKGKKHIRSIINEHKNNASITEFKGLGIDGNNKVKSSRYFTIKFSEKSIPISPVFYTDESTPPNMIYMDSPTNILWPSLIEKAYAVLHKGYDVIGSTNLTLNKVWEDVVNHKYDYFDLRENKINKNSVLKQAKKAKQQPMVAALTGFFHGFVVKGIKNNKITLYDPSSLENKDYSINELKTRGTVLFYWK